MPEGRPDSWRRPFVLHYSGMPTDTGGILTIVRWFSTGLLWARSACVVGPSFAQRRTPTLKLVQGLPMACEVIGPATLLRTLVEALRLLPALLRREHRWFHGHTRAGMLVAFWLTLFGCDRAVASIHCYGRQIWLYRLLAVTMGPRLVFLSPQMKRWYGVGPPDSWSGCVPEMVDAAERPLESPFRTGDRLRLAYLGTIVERKGLLTLLQGLARLDETERACVDVHIIGSAEPETEAQEYARACEVFVTDKRLQDGVTFHGWMNDPWAFLRSEVDWLAMPSVREPFALSILEALREGRPVFGADSGGIPDIIRDWRNGLLFRTGDPEDVARGLRAILAAPAWPTAEEVRASMRAFTVPTLVPAWRSYYASL